MRRDHSAAERLFIVIHRYDRGRILGQQVKHALAKLVSNKLLYQ